MKKNILPVEQSREYLLSMLEKGTKSAADTGGTDTASGGYGAARSKKQKVAALIRPELTIPAGAETDADTGGYWDEEADARYDAFLKDYEKTAVPAGAETDARTDGEGDALSGEQKLDAKIAAKLPESFPVDEWETLTTKQQLKAMQFSGLTNEEQWRLLNASMPLKELVRAQEKEKEQIRAALKAALEETSEDAETQQSGRSGGTLSGAGGGRGIGDTGTDSSKLTPLQQRILDRQLEKEEEALDQTAISRDTEQISVPKSLTDYPAIQTFTGTQELTMRQSAGLVQADIMFTILKGKKGTTQQDIDELIAKTCTSLLTKENAPVNNDGVVQTEIPAYTDAIDGLLGRLRADGDARQEELRQMSLHSGIHQQSVYSSLIYQMIEFKAENGEKGALNLRNRDAWEDLIKKYSENADPLRGSQYLFVYYGEVMSVEDLGNAVYGYYGSALGFPKKLLYFGAGYAAVSKAADNDEGSLLDIFDEYMGDTEADRMAIDKGISWYQEGR